MGYEYQGDVNLEYGGSFIDLSTFDDGYCTAVRVTDLDSGCGFTGAVAIEHVVINGTDDPKRIMDALRYCGYDRDELAKFISACLFAPNDPLPREMLHDYLKDNPHYRHMIADSLLNYEFVDPDDSWDNYRSYHTEIVQCEPDGPMRYGGWKVDKRLHNTTLEDYVSSQHLR